MNKLAVFIVGTVMELSLQPNQPGVLQELVVVMSGLVAVMVDEKVVGSLQPNHPGVLQVLVVAVETEVVVMALVGSLQPNHPGVLQVSVRDKVVLLEVVVTLLVTGGSSVPLL